MKSANASKENKKKRLNCRKFTPKNRITYTYFSLFGACGFFCQWNNVCKFIVMQQKIFLS